jgi:predicted nucleic acid-binding protein
MTASVIVLDVNIPMYAAGQEHPYKSACVWVMTQIAAGQLTTAIDTEIIQEILYRYGFLKRWDIAVAMATNLLRLVPVVYPIQPPDTRLAVELFEQYAPRGVTARDILHAAVMQNNNLPHIISTDRHFDQIEGIVRLDPQVLFDQA